MEALLSLFLFGWQSFCHFVFIFVIYAVPATIVKQKEAVMMVLVAN